MKRFLVITNDGRPGFQFETLIAAIFCGLMLNAMWQITWGIYDDVDKYWVV